MNWSNDRRWIYIYFQLVERVQQDWYITESFTIFWKDSKDWKLLVEELSRASKKKLEQHCNTLKNNEAKIFDMYENDFNPHEIKNLFI